jgi:hypothetical protein
MSPWDENRESVFGHWQRRRPSVAPRREIRQQTWALERSGQGLDRGRDAAAPAHRSTTPRQNQAKRSRAAQAMMWATAVLAGSR